VVCPTATYMPEAQGCSCRPAMATASKRRSPKRYLPVVSLSHRIAEA
jgi:hypothetical protein